MAVVDLGSASLIYDLCNVVITKGRSMRKDDGFRRLTQHHASLIMGVRIRLDADHRLASNYDASTDPELRPRVRRPSN
jgi:hypothetical protein